MTESHVHRTALHRKQAEVDRMAASIEGDRMREDGTYLREATNAALGKGGHGNRRQRRRAAALERRKT